MPKIQYRPLVWDLPRTPWNQLRDRNTFKQTWTAIQDLLDRELRQVNATEITLELDVTEGAIKQDGGLRAGAGPGFQGIRLSFNLADVGRVFFATDKHEFWQHNVYAIGRALEALRLVERYGINQGNEQYTGFKAIEAGSNGTGRRAAATWIAKLLYEVAESQKNTRDALLNSEESAASKRSIVAAAKKKAHPDTGGSHEMFQLLDEKLKVLGL
jgi:hypothetical protein